MAALAVEATDPELEATIAEEEHQIKHLVRSNAELEAFLAESPDRDLREAVGENIVVIARKRAALQLLYEKRHRPPPADTGAPLAVAPPLEAAPRPPVPAPAPVTAAGPAGSEPAAAQPEPAAAPEGSVYL